MNLSITGVPAAYLQSIGVKFIAGDRHHVHGTFASALRPATAALWNSQDLSQSREIIITAFADRDEQLNIEDLTRKYEATKVTTLC